jgi:sulfate transport system ATP-binding protein
MRQRLALLRTFLTDRNLLLLDEPFGALDAQVRVTLRRWLRALHEDLGLTTVFVTHDQEEALELADRIAVMNRGRVEQVGTPETIYQHPETPFVCEFIGKANRIDLTRTDRGMTAAEWNLGEAPWGADFEHALAYVRPEHLSLNVSTSGPGWPARLRHIYLAGSVAHLELDVPSLGRHMEAQIATEDLERLDLRTGASLRVSPRRAIAFASSDAQGTSIVGNARWIWQAANAPVPQPAAIPSNRAS